MIIYLCLRPFHSASYRVKRHMEFGSCSRWDSLVSLPVARKRLGSSLWVSDDVNSPSVPPMRRTPDVTARSLHSNPCSSQSGLSSPLVMLFLEASSLYIREFIPNIMREAIILFPRTRQLYHLTRHYNKYALYKCGIIYIMVVRILKRKLANILRGTDAEHRLL